MKRVLEKDYDPQTMVIVGDSFNENFITGEIEVAYWCIDKKIVCSAQEVYNERHKCLKDLYMQKKNVK